MGEHETAERKPKAGRPRIQKRVGDFVVHLRLNRAIIAADWQLVLGLNTHGDYVGHIGLTARILSPKDTSVPWIQFQSHLPLANAELSISSCAMNLGAPSGEAWFLVQKCVRLVDRAVKRRISGGRNQVFNGVVGEGDSARQIRPAADGLRRNQLAV